MNDEIIKELEDTPPLSFMANGESLIDWRIDGKSGGVGDSTSNLWNLWTNETYRGVTVISENNKIILDNECTKEGNIYSLISLSAGTYTLAANANKNLDSNTVMIQIYKANVILKSISADQMVNGTATFTLENDEEDVYLRIHVLNGIDYSGVELQPMLNVGSSSLPFEPYGKYKIPVICGGETKTIYLDEPLEVSDSISMTDTGISIPTVSGSNTFSIGTTVQPSSVYIKYKKGGDGMVTLAKIGGRYNTPLLEIRGLSTDTKPTTKIEGMIVTNGSTYIEIDTGDTYMFDAENGVWHNITG